VRGKSLTLKGSEKVVKKRVARDDVSGMPAGWSSRGIFFSFLFFLFSWLRRKGRRKRKLSLA
jgi:hypothetical protein